MGPLSDEAGAATPGAAATTGLDATTDGQHGDGCLHHQPSGGDSVTRPSY